MPRQAELLRNCDERKGVTSTLCSAQRGSREATPPGTPVQHPAGTRTKVTWGGCDEHEGGEGGGYALPPPTPRGETACLALFFHSGDPDAIHELIKASPSGSPHQNSHSGRSCTFIIDTVANQTARAPTAHTTTPTQTNVTAPRSRASTHHDPAHTAGHTTYSSVCSWGRWTRAAPMAAAPAAPMPQFSSLHTHKSHTQRQDRERMPWPRVPLQAHTTTPHTQPGTQRTPVSAAGAGGPGLHR
jgi:hypothetical protein